MLVKLTKCKETSILYSQLPPGSVKHVFGALEPVIAIIRVRCHRQTYIGGPKK